jgi:hypothetical protein
MRAVQFMVVLSVLLTACGGVTALATPIQPTPTTVNVAPTQTRAAELAQIATLTAPTATLTATPLPATPTATPAATSTPRPTPTSRPPNPTATVPAKVSVTTEKVTTYYDTLGSLWVIGEIINNGTADVSSMRVAVSIVDANGQVLASGGTDVDAVWILHPTEYTVWRVLMDKAPATTGKVTVQAQAAPTSDYFRHLAHTGLKAQGVKIGPDAFGLMSASGQVVNTGTTTAALIHITIGAYDANSNLIAVEDTFAQLNTIAPGQSAPFSMTIARLDAPPAFFETFVSGTTGQ